MPNMNPDLPVFMATTPYHTRKSLGKHIGKRRSAMKRFSWGMSYNNCQPHRFSRLHAALMSLMPLQITHVDQGRGYFRKAMIQKFVPLSTGHKQGRQQQGLS